MLLANNTFVRQVVTLLAGNGVAQLLTIAAAPLLTRLYSPEEFGALALFVALFSGVAPGVCGRYEMAVVVASREDDSRAFLVISLWFSVLVSLLSLVLLGTVVLSGGAATWVDTLGNWLWVTPLALLFTGLITALRAYGNAREDYKTLTTSAVIQSAATTSLALIFGYAFSISDGQLFASIAGLFITALVLMYVFRSLLVASDFRWNSEKSKLALRHKDYPLFNATASILNGIMAGLPVFFLTSHFAAEIVGYFALLVRVGVVPLSFISDAVSRVNLRKISVLLSERQNLFPYVKRITIGLLLIASVPSAVLMVSAPSLFSWVFGEHWRAAGTLLCILMPSILIQFVVSTLSLSFIAAGHHRLQALWQVASFAVTVLVFSFSVGQGVDRFFWAYMIKDIGLYLLYYAMLIFALKNPKTVDTG